MSEEVKSASEKKKEDWMNSKWRPMMGWMYMLVCTMDMVVFPILWSLLQTLTHTQITQWSPLTLQGAGLFHIAMGAVLGIAAFGRTQEKLGGANNGGLQTSTTGFASGPTTFGATTTAGFGAPASTFGGSNVTNIQGSTFNSGGFGTTASTAAPGGFGGGSGFGAPTAPSTGVTVGFGGKKAPPAQFDPEI
jgi:hypothetical protein